MSADERPMPIVVQVTTFVRSGRLAVTFLLTCCNLTHACLTSTRMTHLQRGSELNYPRSRDETSRASPAVIQAGARRAARGRIGCSESAVLLLQRLCGGRRACGRKFRECRKHDTFGPVCSVTLVSAREEKGVYTHPHQPKRPCGMGAQPSSLRIEYQRWPTRLPSRRACSSPRPTRR